jgi:cell division initiation protein
MREYREREETLKNTMITTHKLAEDIKESSKKEAQLIVKDAEIKYQQTLERAREEKLRLEAELHELRRKKHHFVQDMLKMIEMHKNMLEFDGTADEKPEQQQV